METSEMVDLMIHQIESGDVAGLTGLLRSLSRAQRTLLLNACGSGGQTALMFACDGEAEGEVETDTSILRALLGDGGGGGAEVSMANASGRTALHFAAARGNVRAAELLLCSVSSPEALSAVVNAVDAEDMTPLLVAADEGHLAVVELLLGRENLPVNVNVNVNAHNAEGKSALMLASEHGHTAILERLLRGGSGVSVNAMGEVDGNTALHVAADGRQFEAVILLLNAGANPGARNARGETPTAVAQRKGYFKLAQVLAQSEAFTQTPTLPSPEALASLQIPEAHARCGLCEAPLYAGDFVSHPCVRCPVWCHELCLRDSMKAAAKGSHDQIILNPTCEHELDYSRLAFVRIPIDGNTLR